MRGFPALIAALAVLVSATPAHAVVGGQPAPEGEFKYVANVRVLGAFGCTGTLIAPQWIITAGHCGSATAVVTQGILPTSTPLPPESYEVVLGSVHADGRGGETHGVTEIVLEPDYSFQNGAGNDVALMKLDTPSRTATPMRIAAVGERSIWRPGALSTVAGFGLTSEDADGPPDRMHFTQVPITTDAYCAEAYKDSGVGPGGEGGAFDARTMVCAGYPEGGRDTCNGDSGGPLLAPAAGGSLRLVGATSFGDGCGRPGKPGVYARVAEGPIREWIRGVVPEAFAPEPKPAATKKRRWTNRRCKRMYQRAKTRRERARALRCERRARARARARR